MLDARKILADLQRHAERAARDLEASGAVEKAKETASSVRERLKTDPQARTVAAGAGGLLLLGMLGSKGGRRMIGDIAQTGAVAALGALAYKTWMEKQGRSVGANPVKEAEHAGFPVDLTSDPDFALAIVRAMLASAYADGVLDAHEQRTVDSAMDQSGLTKAERAMLTNDMPRAETIALIADAAKTPQKAAELYAAAVISAGDLNDRETQFLSELATGLGLNSDEVDAIRNSANG